ncbi:hypothetical protein ACNKHU_12780 [Shigella flexneri]
MFSEVMRYILDLGPTVMLPIVIIIFSKFLGMKAGDCFKRVCIWDWLCWHWPCDWLNAEPVEPAAKRWRKIST